MWVRCVSCFCWCCSWGREGVSVFSRVWFLCFVVMMISGVLLIIVLFLVSSC